MASSPPLATALLAGALRLLRLARYRGKFIVRKLRVRFDPVWNDHFFVARCDYAEIVISGYGLSSSVPESA